MDSYLHPDYRCKCSHADCKSESAYLIPLLEDTTAPAVEAGSGIGIYCDQHAANLLKEAGRKGVRIVLLPLLPSNVNGI